jgi:hypothetical protein
MEPEIHVLPTVGFVAMHHVRDIAGSASFWLKREFRGDEWRAVWCGGRSEGRQQRIGPDEPLLVDDLEETAEVP